MRLPKFRYALLTGGVFGLVGCITIYVYVSWRDIFFPPDWVLLFWPSSIMFMSMGDRYGPFTILCFRVITNIFIYVLVAAVIWCVAWVIRAWRKSLRDGTTI